MNSRYPLPNMYCHNFDYRENQKEYKITIRMRDGEIKHAHQETLNSIKVGSMLRLKDGKAKLYK